MLKGNLSLMGGGNMAEALIKGIIGARLLPPEKIIVSDIRKERLEFLQETYKIATSGNNQEVVAKGEVIILAVKPQNVEEVLKEVGWRLDETKLFLSLVAGVTLSYLKDRLKNNPRLIRLMPNTPVLIRQGITAISPAPSARKADLKIAQKIFNSVGKTVIIEENLIDAVTGLSGSGPAYIFLIMEALIEAGVKVGLGRGISQALVIQTILGTVRLVEETKETPEKLREKVTSPGGTTMAGLQVLEEGKIKATFIKAIEAATRRSQELGGLLERK